MNLARVFSTALLIIGLTQVAPFVADESPECGDQLMAASLSGLDATGCDLHDAVVVLDDGRELPVPEPGEGISSWALTEDGMPEADDVSLYRDEAGNLALAVEDVFSGDPDAIEDLQSELAEEIIVGGSAPTTSKCSTSAPYNWSGHWWRLSAHEYRYSYNSAGAPSGASARITAAANAVANGTSGSCGNRNSALTIVREGTTTVYAGINAAGSRTGRSFVSEVSFGPIDGSYLAWACTYWALGGELVEADIKFDNSSRSWNTNASSCSSGYDLQGVATHEFGHAVGLGHVADLTSGQVMVKSTGTCNVGQRHLGRGDQRGLIAVYG